MGEEAPLEGDEPADGEQEWEDAWLPEDAGGEQNEERDQTRRE